MALGRLIRDGEAQRYLAEVCPQAGHRLCAHRDGLQSGWDGANLFLWGRDSPFGRIGGWGPGGSSGRRRGRSCAGPG
jgi:hypothetical protein